MCNSKAGWAVEVVHDGQPDMEHFCDRCYDAYNYGFRQCLFQNVRLFTDEARAHLAEQGVQ